MIDRKAKVKDYWEIVKTRKRFPQTIKEIYIPESDTTSEIKIEVNSALISLCGKNGAGKTSILEYIYHTLTNDCEENPKKIKDSYIKIHNKTNNSDMHFGNTGTHHSKVVYLDPSDEALNIRRKIINDYTFREDYDNEENESDILQEAIGYIRKILFKDIKKITVIEVEGKLEDSEILPYLKIHKSNITYDNINMGQGEHKVIYLIWRLLTAENNSIILLEEPEAFLCSKSQEYLMDFLAYIIQKKKIHIILTTHSDVILKNQNITSCSIVKRATNDKILLTKENKKAKYLHALGLTPPKKGIFLVEDRFAKIFLEEVFSYFSSTLSSEYHIDILNGESNIIETNKHYKSQNLNIIPILDADMLEKDHTQNGMTPINFLPSVKNLAPEEEIVEFIKDNQEEYAKSLSKDAETINEAIAAIFVNHHDWFEELNNNLEYDNQKHLERTAIRAWIKNHLENVEKFLTLLENIDIKNKSKLENTGNEFYFTLNNNRFITCEKTNSTFRLDNFIGQDLYFELTYCGGEIKSKILKIS